MAGRLASTIKYFKTALGEGYRLLSRPKGDESPLSEIRNVGLKRPRLLTLLLPPINICDAPVRPVPVSTGT